MDDVDSDGDHPMIDVSEYSFRDAWRTVVDTPAQLIIEKDGQGDQVITTEKPKDQTPDKGKGPKLLSINPFAIGLLAWIGWDLVKNNFALIAGIGVVVFSGYLLYKAIKSNNNILSKKAIISLMTIILSVFAFNGESLAQKVEGDPFAKEKSIKQMTLEEKVEHYKDSMNSSTKKYDYGVDGLVKNR